MIQILNGLFFIYIVVGQNKSMKKKNSREPDSNQRPKDIRLFIHYSLPLYQLSYHGMMDEVVTNTIFNTITSKGRNLHTVYVQFNLPPFSNSRTVKCHIGKCPSDQKQS